MILKNNTKIFSITKKMKKIYCVICDEYRQCKNLKISQIFERTFLLFLLFLLFFLSIICSKCRNEDERIFKKEESVEILKILDVIEIM